jgi:Kdo2-lipid IVA lauroyltransferase/acyltransferase
MGALLYYLVVFPISLLPYPILYAFSDFLYLAIYYVVRYRKKVVLRNIQKSFPQLTHAEHIALSKKFYRHFCDLVVESLKIFTITEEEVKARMKIVNPEFINSYFEKGESMILAGGHFNNWELFAVAIAAPLKHETFAIYQPLKNRFFDEKMRETRGKFGLKLISTKFVKPFFEQQKSTPTITIFAIDQSPGRKSSSYTMQFLNQETQVLFGTEKYSREYNYPVVFGRINKLKRGYYSFEFLEVMENPRDKNHGEITEHVTRLLEKDIIANPEFWLWSHKRWKSNRKNRANS